MTPGSGQRGEAKLAAAGIAGAATLWGLWPLWIRSGDRAIATAFLAMALTVLPSAIRERRAARSAGVGALSRADMIALAALSLANTWNAWLYFRGVHAGPIAVAAITHYLAPLFVAALAPMVLGEPRSSRTPLALFLALAGTGILFGGGDFARPGAKAAAAYGAASAILFAAGILLAKKLLARARGAELLFWHATASVLFLACLGAWPLFAWRPIVGGVLSGAFGGLIYYYGVARLPAERVGVLAYFEPVAATLVGALFLHETPGGLAVVGGALVILAGALVVTAPAAR